MISAIASSSSWSKASLRAVLVSASSFLASSSFLTSSSTLALAFSASSFAFDNSASASVFALSASSFAFSAAFTSSASFVALVVASSTFLASSATFFSNSETLASASNLASAAFSASVFSAGLAGSSSTGLDGSLASFSLAAFTSSRVLLYSSVSLFNSSATTFVSEAAWSKSFCAASRAASAFFVTSSKILTISSDEPFAFAVSRAFLVFCKVSSLLVNVSAFLSSSAFNALASFWRASTFSPKSSALSWSFSDAGRAASAFSALSIPALISSGKSSFDLASAGVVAVLLAVLSSFSNSLRISPAFKSPDSTAANVSSLPNAFLASSLFVILALAAISFSNWSKAFDKASLESASSFFASSSFFSASFTLASASAAFSLAAANSSSTVFLASSALVFAASASADSFFSASSFVSASLAVVVVVSTFAWASLTFASASFWASLAFSTSVFLTVVSVDFDTELPTTPITLAGCSVVASPAYTLGDNWFNAAADKIVAVANPVIKILFFIEKHPQNN